MPADTAAGGFFLANNGTNYPLQTDMQGQYHNEIIATAEREVIDDLTVRLDYQHRWLGNDHRGRLRRPGGYTFVLANPGNVPQSAIAARPSATRRTRGDQRAGGVRRRWRPTRTTRTCRRSRRTSRTPGRRGQRHGEADTLQDLANAPKPERTYDAITLSVNKRFSKNWLARASYTYSRLIGNYEGLYQAEQNYFAPNGNNAYDTPDLYVNQNGPLPNDRPHLAHVDGFYSHRARQRAS